MGKEVHGCRSPTGKRWVGFESCPYVRQLMILRGYSGRSPTESGRWGLVQMSLCTQANPYDYEICSGRSPTGSGGWGLSHVHTGVNSCYYEICSGRSPTGSAVGGIDAGPSLYTSQLIYVTMNTGFAVGSQWQIPHYKQP